ncbi:MAG: hypothetical protein JO002_05565 [Burkholderiaceae bacterium]|nr:hypothetical protein [Burkholderiaceae bacterium]
MSAPMSREEYLAILLAPARRNPEPSRALPSSSYRDPALNVQLEADKRKSSKQPKAKKHKPPKVNKKWR